MPSTPLRSPPGSASTGSIRSIDPAAPAAAMPAAGWTMETLAAFLQAPRGTDPLRALVVHLAASLRCDRAALGLRPRRGAEIEVMAVSDVLRPQDAGELVRDLHAAMMEASASACTLTHPSRRASPVHPGLAHVQLGRVLGACAVCSVPLGAGGRVGGVLTLQRDLGAPFRTEEILRLEQVAQFLAPVLQLHLAGRRRAAVLDLSSGPAWLQSLRRHLLMTALALGTALALLPVGHEVVAPARVRGLHERQLVAPRDGFIAVVHARPGQRVVQGQPLLDLDGEAARQAQRAAQAGLSQAETAVSEAQARHDPAQLVVQMARVEEAQARLEQAREDEARSRVAAPLDGLVVEGDLSRSVGAPVRRGEVLMTVAPSDGFRLVLWVDERDVGALRIGTPGALRVAARPGQALALTVTRITPVAQVREGRNGFEVEAALVGAAPELRPGFEGVARLEAGRRLAVQALLGRLPDALRMGWWTLFG
ncbi:MAG: hypothetical protein RLZZ592_204 [Pseudomonadota bacterium]|jgi:multidrug resistance efflux pump